MAGKWWGPRNQRPVVCLHGHQVMLIFGLNDFPFEIYLFRTMLEASTV
jgi:hypothetical protein